MDYRSIIESRYNRQNWQELLHDIFRQRVEFWQHPQSVPVDESMAKGALYTGKITLPDGHIIAIYEVELSDSIVIERNRAGIRNLLCASWRGMGCSGAFMFCFRQNEAILRFSYVSEPFVFAEDGSITKESTDTKRFTYLLGEGHRSRTAIKQFEYLKNSALDLKSITKAFSVEALSDEFFKEYKKHYEDIIEYITGKRMVKVANKWEEQVIGQPCSVIMQEFSHFTDAEKAVRDYVKKLMGRLVFIQFLQKKGWMGCSAGESWNDGDKEFVQNLFENTTCKDTFVDDVLEPLFNDINTKRKDDITSSKNVGNGIKIPYLNGGLFERDDYDKTNFPLPAKYMKNLLDFFASYNFTIDENDPDDAEIGVDPEMLGRIFENLLEDNKDKGAFYTPKEIVQYMCRESLIAYLQTDVNDEQTKDDIRQFVTTYNASVLSDDLKEIVDQKLKDVKICDPAIGSGAFPMGLLRELYACRKAIEGIDDESAVSIKTHIIQSNIYGVDIEKGAVDIARLRFWLALIVDEKTPHALPNLDYKIMQGNSLITTFNGEYIDLDTKAYNKNVKELRQKEIELNNYIHQFYDSHDNQKYELTVKIKVSILSLISIKLKNEIVAWKDKNRNQSTIDLGDNVDTLKNNKDPFPQEKQNLLNYANALLEKFNDENITIEERASININFFDWQIMFSEVFDNGGFDIVIGNPPYIRIQTINAISPEIVPIYNQQYENVASGNYDFYILFTWLGFNLLNSTGVLTYIQPNKFLQGTSGKKLRKQLKVNGALKKLIDFGTNQVFNSATTYTCILHLSHKEYPTFEYKKFNLGENIWELSDIEFSTIDTSSLNEDENWTFNQGVDNELIDKLKHAGLTFNQITTKIFKGSSTGNDKVFLLNVIDDLGDRLVVTSVAKQEHFLVEKAVCRQFIYGESVTRYAVPQSTTALVFPYVQKNGKYRVYESDELEALYPLASAYLNEFKTELLNRKAPLTENSFFKFSAARSLNEYEQCKILIPDMLVSSRIGYDPNGLFFTGPAIHCPIFSTDIDPKFYLAILNSKVFWYYISNTSTALRGNAYRLTPEFLNPFSFPDVNGDEIEQVAEIVTSILSVKKSNPLADTTVLEAEIDRLVYDLYGLTEDEIRIVEGTVKQ